MADTLDYFLCWLLTLGIMVCAAIARQLQGGWLSPGAIAAEVWAVACILPLLFGSDLPFHLESYGAAFLFVAVLVASTSAARGSGFVGTGAHHRSFRLPHLRRVYTAFLAAGCMAPVVVYLEASGFARSASLEELSLVIAQASYMGEFSEPPMTRLFTIFLYLAAILGGLLMPRANGRPWRWLLWLLPLAATALINTRRGGLLYGGVMFGAGYLAGRAYARAADVPLRRLLAVGGTAGALIASAFVVLQALRMGRLNLREITVVIHHLKSYYNPHMAVLGTWLTDPGSTTGSGLGAYTFAGLADALGLQERKAGLYEVMIDFGDERSNIYTALRPLIEDFGWFGMTLFAATIGLLGGHGWARLKRGDLIGAPALVAYLTFVLWSPITSIYVYNTFLAVFILLYFVLLSAKARPTYSRTRSPF